MGHLAVYPFFISVPEKAQDAVKYACAKLLTVCLTPWGHSLSAGDSPALQPVMLFLIVMEGLRALRGACSNTASATGIYL